IPYFCETLSKFDFTGKTKIIASHQQLSISTTRVPSVGFTLPLRVNEARQFKVSLESLLGKLTWLSRSLRGFPFSQLWYFVIIRTSISLRWHLTLSFSTQNCYRVA